MWLVPSKGRPHLAQRLFDCGIKEKGLLICNSNDQEAYSSVRIPFGWKRFCTNPTWLSVALNLAFDHFPWEPWYGILNDDHIPVTSGWEARMIEEGLKGIAWPNDNYKQRLSSHVKSGDLCRKLGWFVCPKLKHFYLDDVDELIAAQIGGKFLSDIVVSHEHVNAGRMAPDRTYRERPNPALDKEAFLHWKTTEWPGIKEKLAVHV